VQIERCSDPSIQIQAFRLTKALPGDMETAFIPAKRLGQEVGMKNQKAATVSALNPMSFKPDFFWIRSLKIRFW
jgi:hypothetical protein